MNHEQMMRISALQADKADLVEVLKTRFGSVSKDVISKIDEISDLNVMDRLFLVAVNAADWDIFVTELHEGQQSFKIIGESFNPLAKAGGTL